MVDVGETLIELPVPTTVPPHVPLYHLHKLFPFSCPVATDNVVGAPLQIVAPAEELIVGVVAGKHVPIF